MESPVDFAHKLASLTALISPPGFIPDAVQLAAGADGQGTASQEPLLPSGGRGDQLVRPRWQETRLFDGLPCRRRLRPPRNNGECSDRVGGPCSRSHGDCDVCAGGWCCSAASLARPLADPDAAPPRAAADVLQVSGPPQYELESAGSGCTLVANAAPLFFYSPSR